MERPDEFLTRTDGCDVAQGECPVVSMKMNHSVFRNQVKNVARSLVAQEADGGRKGGTLNQVAINTSRRSMYGAGERLGA